MSSFFTNTGTLALEMFGTTVPCWLSFQVMDIKSRQWLHSASCVSLIIGHTQLYDWRLSLSCCHYLCMEKFAKPCDFCMQWLLWLSSSRASTAPFLHFLPQYLTVRCLCIDAMSFRTLYSFLLLTYLLIYTTEMTPVFCVNRSATWRFDIGSAAACERPCHDPEHHTK